MKVHQNLTNLPILSFAVVTSGTFDGVHIGHQKILTHLTQIATQNNGQSVVITFYPHPRNIINQNQTEIKELTTLDEKIDKLEKLGIDHLLILPFTPEFSQISPDEFVQKIYIDALNTKKLVIGYDHRFGKDRAGGLEYLLKNNHQYSFTIDEIPKHDLENNTISSTKIRNALAESNIKIANQYLGNEYELRGKIVNGDKIGRTIGFPTANVSLSHESKLIPADAIYAVKIMLKNKFYQGMMYIGNRPTLSGNLEKRIEVNIFDFQEDVYGENISVFLVDKIRGDEKFDTLEKMKIQLKNDEIKAKQILLE
ncbi:MAG: bifunctional riboflavin kinase/FAD synthetase [Bacteroidetes bacterium]|nr:MAG: bifunctional riboflavin kinase/FAD synthetase [Bacteroidota bacterium]